MTWTWPRPRSAVRNHSRAGRCCCRSTWLDLYSERLRGVDRRTATTSAASATVRSTLAWVITGEVASRRLLPEKPDSSQAISIHGGMVIKKELPGEGLHAVSRRGDGTRSGG